MAIAKDERFHIFKSLMIPIEIIFILSFANEQIHSLAVIANGLIIELKPTLKLATMLETFKQIKERCVGDHLN